MDYLIYLGLVKENRIEFNKKVIVIASKLGIDPNWLMGVFFIECKLDHRAQNGSTGATGLIQFMPETAAELGTTCEAILAMSNLQQLDYVLKYYQNGIRSRGKLYSFIDCYLLTFFPLAIGKPYTYVFQTSTLPPSIIAQQNPNYDRFPKDGKVTKHEVELAVLGKIDKWYRAMLTNQVVSIVKPQIQIV